MTRSRALWWFLFPLLTFGMATFAVVGYAGGRLHDRRHIIAAAAYFVMLVGFFVGVQFTAPETTGAIDAIIFPPFLVNWLVGTAHAAWLERKLKIAPIQLEPAVLAAQQRLARRTESRALLLSNPVLAAELRIGRPDLGRHYDDGGLLDINHVPASIMACELGIPLPIAEEIVAQRTTVGGFHSADDLVVYCSAVTPHQVELIRDRLLFTPV